jgi:hypothetical protein
MMPAISSRSRPQFIEPDDVNTLAHCGRGELSSCGLRGYVRSIAANRTSDNTGMIENSLE